MAGVIRLFELESNTEASFAENAENPTANTFDTRQPVLDYTFTPAQERIVDGGYRSRMNDEGLSHIGIRTGTLEVETYLPGHLTTSAGSLTQTWIHAELAAAFGGSLINAAGTTLTGATTGSSITFTSNTNWAVGQIGWCGAKGDGKGDGQAFVVGTVGAPMTLLTALNATPAAADVIYAGLQVYHDESLAYTLPSRRFKCGFTSSPTAGAQFQLMGCSLSAVTIKLPFGDLPRIRRTYQVAYWQRFGTTVPSTTNVIKDQFCAPTAAGRFFVNDFGTATAAVETPSELDLSIDLGLEPIIAPGGNGVYQNITGFVRSKAQPTLTVKIPWKTTYESWWDTANQSILFKHILFNANCVDGRRIAFYLPKVFPVGQRPSQPTESNRQMYVSVTFKGIDDLSKSTELGKSAFRLAMG